MRDDLTYYLKLSALACVSLALALMRLLGVTGLAFQAVAHLWVGGLIAARIRGRDSTGTGCMYLAIALSVVEIVAALKFDNLFGTLKP